MCVCMCVCASQVDYVAMLDALGESCKEMGIQPVKAFVDKVRVCVCVCVCVCVFHGRVPCAQCTFRNTWPVLVGRGLTSPRDSVSHTCASYLCVCVCVCVRVCVCVCVYTGHSAIRDHHRASRAHVGGAHDGW